MWSDASSPRVTVIPGCGKGWYWRITSMGLEFDALWKGFRQIKETEADLFSNSSCLRTPSCSLLILMTLRARLRHDTIYGPFLQFMFNRMPLLTSGKLATHFGMFDMSVCTNVNRQQLDLSFDPLLLCLTAGGPHTNAQSYVLVRFQQHSGHNSALNYSLCKINTPLTAQIGLEKPGGKVGKCLRDDQEEEVVAIQGRYLHINLNPYWIQGTLFHGCPLEAQRLACCDGVTLTAGTAQSSLSFHFLLAFFICRLGDFEETLIL